VDTAIAPAHTPSPGTAPALATTTPARDFPAGLLLLVFVGILLAGGGLLLLGYLFVLRG